MKKRNRRYVYTCGAGFAHQRQVVGTKGDVYTLTYDPRDVVPWACTCKGYHYRGICGHIRKAEADHCDWEHPVKGRPNFNHQKPGGYGLCPMCSSPVRFERVAK